mmetsp:Transcript_10880/g.36047  ORF Transcript_10880/g.36047 Transcript_10880/m.36047 type:complete len:212 (-) Transcript_10880:269-904(-)
MELPIKSSGDRLPHSTRSAQSAADSNRGSAVRRESMPISSSSVPAPAVHCSWCAARGRPPRRRTKARGSSVQTPRAAPGSKAVRKRSPRSAARRRSPPSYPETVRCSAPATSPAANRWADRRPPSTRMLVSKSETSTSWSNVTCCPTHRTPQANSEALPSTASVSSESIRVSATPAYPSRVGRTALPSSIRESVYERESGRSSSCGNAWVM